MASVFLSYDEGTTVKDLPHVCMACGSPATMYDRVKLRDQDRKATIDVPLCGGHAPIDLLTLVGIGGVVVVLGLAGVLALAQWMFPRLLPVNQPSLMGLLMAFLVILWGVAFFYLRFTALRCARIEANGVVMTNVSSLFVQALDAHEEEDEQDRRKNRLRQGKRINVNAVLRQLGIIVAISSVLFVPIAFANLLPRWQRAAPRPQAHKQPEPPQPSPGGNPLDNPADNRPDNLPDILPGPPPPTVPAPAAGIPDLLAYWGFEDDNPGRWVADQAKKGQNGKAVGATQIAGVHGKALEFTNNAYFAYGKKAGLNFPSKGGFTLACWVKSTAASGVIISQRHSTDAGSLIEAFLTDGRFHVDVRQDKAFFHLGLTSKSRVADGQWHHCAFLRSGDTIEIYVDGIREEKGTSPDVVGPITTDLRAVAQEGCWALGKEGPKRGYTGAVDEFCIFGRALDPTEIKALATR